MSHRLDKEPTVVTWTAQRKIVVGHHDCNACGVESPSPTQDQLLKVVRERGNGSYLWPGDDWLPPGWAVLRDYGLFCPECVEAVHAALRKRGWKK
jgi:hypothetical protein